MFKVESVVAYQDQFSSEVVVGFQREGGKNFGRYKPGPASLARLQKAIRDKVNCEGWTMMPTCHLGFGYVAFRGGEG